MVLAPAIPGASLTTLTPGGIPSAVVTVPNDPGEEDVITWAWVEPAAIDAGSLIIFMGETVTLLPEAREAACTGMATICLRPVCGSVWMALILIVWLPLAFIDRNVCNNWFV